MKKILILVGAFVGVGVVGFLFGFVSQMGKTKALQNEAQLCRDSAAAAATSAQETIGLLELYRARAELQRNNFGTAGDALGRAKEKLAGDAFADSRKTIDDTTAKVLKQEAAAADDIGAIIKAVEAKGLPKTP